MSRLLLTLPPTDVGEPPSTGGGEAPSDGTPASTAGSAGGDADAATTEAPRSYANAKGEAG